MLPLHLNGAHCSVEEEGLIVRPNSCPLDLYQAPSFLDNSELQINRAKAATVIFLRSSTYNARIERPQSCQPY